MSAQPPDHGRTVLDDPPTPTDKKVDDLNASSTIGSTSPVVWPMQARMLAVLKRNIERAAKVRPQAGNLVSN